jgi:hypothetical protein
MLEILNFCNLVIWVFILNFVALSGFLGMFKHVNTRKEICPKLKSDLNGAPHDLVYASDVAMSLHSSSHHSYMFINHHVILGAYMKFIGCIYMQ